jgi:EAL domain-containing protein (putative c-di-GMP-specific phosphodiesterase class I)
MHVVAEGVEREDQVEILRELKCDIIQGFLWGRPQPARSIPALLLAPAAADTPAQTTVADHSRAGD